MDGPVLVRPRNLGCAYEFIGSAAQEVATRLIAQRPSSRSVVGDADLEASSSVSIFCFAQNVAERVNRQVFAQMRSQVNNAC